MASYTENLNLLKKDPVADGADTFNIETMLNENWDKIDKAKGEIDASLSNKVKNSLGVAGQDLFVWANTQTVGGGFWVDSAVTTINNPLPGTWLIGELSIGEPDLPLIKVTEPFSGRKFEARKYLMEWKPWVEIATATPPQEYDLTLAEGLSGTAKYSKDQFGYVHVRGRVVGVSVGKTISFLPEGFRPKQSTARIVAQSSPTTEAAAARIDIGETLGSIVASTSTNASYLPNWVDIDFIFASVDS